MIVIGIHTGHSGGAAIVKDGKLVAALASERLTRQQKSHGISNELLDYVMGVAGVSVGDIDAVSITDWSQQYAHSAIEVQSDNGRGIENRWNAIYDGEIENCIALLRGRRIPAHIIGHQHSHCAAAYYTSNLDRSWCFSMDASGANLKNNSLIARGEGNKLHWVECPKLMIGVAYGYFCEWLGIGPQMHKAGSMMGLAAYGKPLGKVVGNPAKYIDSAFIEQDSGHHSWMKWLWDDITTGRTHRWADLEPGQESQDIAATMQWLLERCVLKAVGSIKSQPTDSICLGGGSLLNCNVNSAILNSGQFAKVHLFPACTDDGLCVGSALLAAHHIYDEPRATYSDAEICYLGRDRACESFDVAGIAQQIADGKVVAICQGRAEYGPRALGNRSILADPRRPDYRDKLNSIKRREWFRPFAPVVMQEHLHDWFEFKADASPFMLFTAKLKFNEISSAPQPADIVPAITHVDGTARMQTVTRSSNPMLWELVNEFYGLTGVPMLLNTSMNESGVPMVESDGDIESFWQNVPVDMMVVDGKIRSR